MAADAVERTLENQAWVDKVADPLQKAVGKAMKPGPVGTPLRNILDGTFLGHPLHVVTSDMPIGAWTAASVLDIVSLLPFARKLETGIRWTMGVGLVASLAAVASGLADWHYLEGRNRRRGIVHGLTQLLGTTLYAGSLGLRIAGSRGAAKAFSFAGLGVQLFGSHLGGDLGHRYGIGVNQVAFQEGPSEFVDVLPADELKEGELKGVKAGQMPVLLVKLEGQIHAIGDTCTHLGCLLSEDGTLQGDIVECECHDSKFEVSTGRVVRGPAEYPEPRFDVRVRGGQIQVRRARDEALGAATRSGSTGESIRQ